MEYSTNAMNNRYNKTTYSDLRVHMLLEKFEAKIQF